MAPFLRQMGCVFLMRRHSTAAALSAGPPADASPVPLTRRVLETAGSPELPEVAAEAAVLVDLLTSRHRALVANLEGAFPELRCTVWQSDATVQVRALPLARLPARPTPL
jgi:hypothetical protein